MQDHFKNAVVLLKELISTPSFSKEEEQTASIIAKYLAVNGVQTSRVKNNVYALNQYFGIPNIHSHAPG